MNDPIAFGGFCFVIVLLVGGAYQFGYANGLARGFRHGLASAQNFARHKESESDQPNGRNHRF